MFEKLIVEQNPHWEGAVGKDGIARSCFPKLLEYLEVRHVISVTGSRRAGKSTLVKQLINHLIEQDGVEPKNIFFLNLEHPYLSQYAKEVEHLEHIWKDYLKLAKPEGKVYCFLDEVQFFSDWQVFVKAHYEQGNVKFVITGSNSALLSGELATLLSGRVLPIEVFPLSFEEIALAKGISDPVLMTSKGPELLEEYLRTGGFPEVFLASSKQLQADILNSYVKTMLYQDVAPRLNLRKSQALERLFVYLITNIGALFSYHKVSSLFELSDKAVKEYIAAFADAYLLFQVERFSYSLKQQIRNPKKIYSIDTGQVNAVAFKFTDNWGRLLENFIFLELKRRGGEIYYYKTEKHYEVDFLVKDGPRIQLIQVAHDIMEEKTRSRELRAIVHACQELKLERGTLVTFDHTETIDIEGITIDVIPAYKF